MLKRNKKFQNCWGEIGVGINEAQLDTGVIYANKDNCKGCSNCIRGCPTIGANVAVRNSDTSHSVIGIDDRHCIQCGTCINTCTHKIRRYHDDSDDFFAALKGGKKISVLAAPAFLLNYTKEYKRILGWLKKQGVNRIYSVSFGADITTWAYLKYIRENNALGMISQPCPSIVSYIEKHEHKLIEKIIPIQSPMMCTAIYLKKYMGVTDELAFISPCIGKKIEIESPRGKGLVKYNVTFVKLMEEVKKSGGRLYSMPESGDEIEYGLGSLYPVPGGLKENIEFYLGEDAFVVQVEGEHHVYEEISRMPVWLKELGTKPVIVDALNCRRGCSYGTAAGNKNHMNHAMSLDAHNLRRRMAKKIGTPGQRLADLNEHFKDLKLQDFMCSYEKTPVSTNDVPRDMLEAAFGKLEKKTQDEKELDCNACGYTSCKNMAKAIALGINHEDNCQEYTKAKLDEKMAYHQEAIDLVREMSKLMHELEKDNVKISGDATNIKEDVDNANELCSKMEETLNQLKKDFSLIHATDREIINIARSTNLISINASIEAAHSGEKGFAVIASEVKDLAKKVITAANSNHDNGEVITATLTQLAGEITTVASRVSDIKESAKLIDGNVNGITDLAHSIVEKLDKMVEN